MNISVDSARSDRNAFLGIALVIGLMIGLFCGWRIGRYFGEKDVREALASRIKMVEQMHKTIVERVPLHIAEGKRDKALADLAQAEREIAQYSEPKK